ncbi:MAG: hypothetical protein JKY67_20355 [Pseudomonadales bacterium]|nr:hypothetical protein [Pseudomonadales bacterium]
MTDEEFQGTRGKVENLRKRNIKGEALNFVYEVTCQGLEVDPEETDFKWHADIVNWPLEKQKQIMLALEISKLSESIKY